MEKNDDFGLKIVIFAGIINCLLSIATMLILVL
jgi:hypothetical protein